MRTRCTPCATARCPASSLAAMPPAATPLAMSPVASVGVIVPIGERSGRSTAGTSAMKKSSSAPRAAAIAAAASSPLMFMGCTRVMSSCAPTGDTTGRKPCAMSRRSSAVSTCTGVPAKPKVSTSMGVARSRPSSSPLTPTARRPCATNAATSCLLASPDSAMRTTSSAPAVVTRRPPTNCGVSPRCCCISEIWSPPPCTMTTRPCQAAANEAMVEGSAASPCVRPPSLTTIGAR